MLPRRPSPILIIAVALILSACAGQPAPLATPTPPPLAQSIVVYGWADDIAPSVLAGFTAEYGVTVDYQSYLSQDEAIESLRRGDAYDVVVLSNEYVALMQAEGQLAALDPQQLPNFKNISANFRDLAYDPGNRHAIPYNWGTDGIVVRTDLTQQPLLRWADLWSAELPGTIVMWPIQRSMIGIALKSLGYSLNTERPEELEAARRQLLALKPRIRFASDDDVSGAPYLVSGEATVVLGNGVRDAVEGRKENPDIRYVLPAEGAILWGDNFVVPASSQNQLTAHLFLNYLLRPESGAQLVEWNLYATPNEAALALIDPIVGQDPLIFPPNEDIRNAEIILPVSPAAQQIYDSIWQEFLAAEQ